MEIAKALFEWLWKRLELPTWPFTVLISIALPTALLLGLLHHRAVMATLRAWTLQKGGRMVHGWRFWSPVARIGSLQLSLSPMRIRLEAAAAGRLWLDSRDIPDHRVKARRAERIRTGDWAFDDAFDACASTRSFGEACLDGDVRRDLLSLSALARQAAPKDEEGDPLHHLRIELDGRTLEARFRHVLDIAAIPGAADLMERLSQRLCPPRP